MVDCGLNSLLSRAQQWDVQRVDRDDHFQIFIIHNFETILKLYFIVPDGKGNHKLLIMSMGIMFYEELVVSVPHQIFSASMCTSISSSVAADVLGIYLMLLRQKRLVLNGCD